MALVRLLLGSRPASPVRPPRPSAASFPQPFQPPLAPRPASPPPAMGPWLVVPPVWQPLPIPQPFTLQSSTSGADQGSRASGPMDPYEANWRVSLARLKSSSLESE